MVRDIADPPVLALPAAPAARMLEDSCAQAAVANQPPPLPPPEPELGSKHSGRGGRPYFTYLNHCRSLAKQAKGTDRSLTAEKMAAVTTRAREAWADMGQEERGVFASIYESGVRNRKQGVQPPALKRRGREASSSSKPPSVDQFGVGTPESPIKPTWFCQVLGNVL